MIVFEYVLKNKYEIVAVVLMIFLGLFNFGWLSLKPLPQTPPGYYENIITEHTQILINLRDQYQSQRDEMRKELASRGHNYLEAAQIALKVNHSEVRYLDFWSAEIPLVNGMLKPFEESKYLQWYSDIPKNARDGFIKAANKINEVNPMLSECNKKAAQDYMILVSGLSAPDAQKKTDILIAQARVIMRNFSQSEHSPSTICDNALVSFFSSVKVLSNIYYELDEAYQNYSERNELYRRAICLFLSFLLFIVCYRCRNNLIKKIAQSMGG